MNKSTQSTDEKLTVYVPSLNRNLEVVDQKDLEKQVAAVRKAQEDGDANS